MGNGRFHEAHLNVQDVLVHVKRQVEVGVEGAVTVLSLVACELPYPVQVRRDVRWENVFKCVLVHVEGGDGGMRGGYVQNSCNATTYAYVTGISFHRSALRALGRTEPTYAFVQRNSS